jgi:hypothetical protein
MSSYQKALFSSPLFPFSLVPYRIFTRMLSNTVLDTLGSLQRRLLETWARGSLLFFYLTRTAIFHGCYQAVGAGVGLALLFLWDEKGRCSHLQSGCIL